GNLLFRGRAPGRAPRGRRGTLRTLVQPLAEQARRDLLAQQRRRGRRTRGEAVLDVLHHHEVGFDRDEAGTLEHLPGQVLPPDRRGGERGGDLGAEVRLVEAGGLVELGGRFLLPLV